MKGFVDNIEAMTVANTYFRVVLYTTEHSQLVLMTLKPREEIGEEVHEHVDQFFRIEKGEGKAVIDGESHDIRDGFAITVPAGTRHNIINTSETESLHLYTIYSPPNHRLDVVHTTKEEALADHEHFDGTTTE